MVFLGSLNCVPMKRQRSSSTGKWLIVMKELLASGGFREVEASAVPGRILEREFCPCGSRVAALLTNESCRLWFSLRLRASVLSC